MTFDNASLFELFLKFKKNHSYFNIFVSNCLLFSSIFPLFSPIFCICAVCLAQVFLSALKLLRTQLRQGSLQQACGCPISYRALHDLVEPLTAWLTNTSQLLEHSDLQHGTDHIWAGAEVLTLFAEQLQLTTDTLAMFSEHLMKVVAAEEGVPSPDPLSANCSSV